jgi:hypothetical protein
MTARNSVKDAGPISAVNGRNARTVKTAAPAPSARSGSKGRRVATAPRSGRIAHLLRTGPIRGNSVRTNTDARLHPAQERPSRAKAITSASGAAAEAATVATVANAANAANTAALHRRHLEARKIALQQLRPRSKDQHRRLLQRRS